MSTDGKLTLKIATPAGVYEGTFEEISTVGEVIEIVVKEMNLAEGDEFDLALDGEKLVPHDRKLGSFNLKDGTVLVLIATGSAV